MVDKTKTPGGVIAGQKTAGQVQQSRTHTTLSRLLDCISKIIQALRFYGFDDINYSTKPTLDHWLTLANEAGGFMPFMKYKLAAFYAACQGEFNNDPQEIPPSPFLTKDTPHILLGGRAYRFIRYLANKNKNSFNELLVTLLQIKKGLERPDEELLSKGKRETYITLTTAPPPLEQVFLPINWADAERLAVRASKSILSEEGMNEEIRRTVIEVFGKVTYTDHERHAPFFPSTSANYIRSRSGGGAIGEILGDFDLLKGLRYKDNMIDINWDEEEGFIMDEKSLLYFYENWETLYKRMFSKAISEIPYAEPVALAEALKVRVITKGPPMLNTVLKPLQKFLWSTMKKVPTFNLIGNWITTDYLTRTLGSTLKPDFGFLSVDYKDATNKIRGSFSEVCARQISKCIGLTEEEEMLFIRALTGHVIVNPDNTDESRPQLNGQLMGSIISFPILCLINASILRLVRELDCNRLFELKSSGVIVNGDDGLLKATSYGVSVWKQIGAFCGLAPSVGKVYFSRRFFNINSTTYEYTEGEVQDEIFYDAEIVSQFRTVSLPFGPIRETYIADNGKLESRIIIHKKDNPIIEYDQISTTKKLKIFFRLVKYINFGLLYDMSRSSSDETNATTPVTSIGERANELLRTCPDHLKESVLSAYMKKHIKTLVSLNIPWYIPEFLGGLGITALPGTRHMPTQTQLRIATKAYLCGIKYPKLRSTDVWRTWKLAMESLPSNKFEDIAVILSGVKDIKIVGRNDEERMERNQDVWSLQNVRSLLVVQTIFTHDLSDLMGKMVKNKHTIEMNYYRKLARLNEKVSLPEFKGISLSKVQPFMVGRFPQSPVDVDNVPFIRSVHPLYDIKERDFDIMMDVIDDLFG